MKLTKCASGHFYDADKYPECPYCNTGLQTDSSIVCSGAAEESRKRPRQNRLFRRLPPPALWPAGWWCWMAKPKAATCALAWAGPFWGWTRMARRYLKCRCPPEPAPGCACLRRRSQDLHAAARFLPGIVLPGRYGAAGAAGAGRGGDPAPGCRHAEIRALLRPGFQLVRGWQRGK